MILGYMATNGLGCGDHVFEGCCPALQRVVIPHANAL